jgi:hypothetical protein
VADNAKKEEGALVPSGATIVPVRSEDGSGAIAVIANGTALVVNLGAQTETPALVQDEPKAVEEAKPVERPADMMTIDEVRKLITRVRRCTFMLSIEVPLYNRADVNRYRPDFQLVEVSAATLLKLLKDITRFRSQDDRWVRVRYTPPEEDKSWSRGFLVLGG